MRWNLFRARRCGQRPPFRLQLEPLEPRWLPSFAFMGAFGDDISHAAASVERVVQQVAAPVKQAVHHAAASVEHDPAQAVQQGTINYFAVKMGDLPDAGANSPAAKSPLSLPGPGESPGGIPLPLPGPDLPGGVDLTRSDDFPGGWINLPDHSPSGLPSGVDLTRPASQRPPVRLQPEPVEQRGLPSFTFMGAFGDDISHATASVERVVQQVAASVKQPVHHTAAPVEHTPAQAEKQGTINHFAVKPGDLPDAGANSPAAKSPLSIPGPGESPGGIPLPLTSPDLRGGVDRPRLDVLGGIHLPLPGPDVLDPPHLPLPGPDVLGPPPLPLPGPDVLDPPHLPLPGPDVLDPPHLPLPGPDVLGGLHQPPPGNLPGGGFDFPGLMGGLVLKNEQGTAPPEQPEKPGQEQGQGKAPQPGNDPFEGFVKNPISLYGKTAEEIANMLGEGWTRGDYGKTGTGWKFTKGDKTVFYHEGGRHAGPYYGFSSGVTGKVKIVGPGYKPLPGDKARIIPG